MRSQDETSPLTDQISDFLLILINPVLIMFMVGSLVFFLLHVTYQGEFQGRIHYAFTLFVFASVLIARIAIEGGSEKAIPFGLALAVAVGLVLLRFQLSGLATFLFVAIVWWCAHRLTWDCTVLENQSEGSGEGLMKSLGMEETQLVEPDTPQISPPPATATATATAQKRAQASWWSWVVPADHAHAPGASVVWFAVAAIPIFGLGSLFAHAAIEHRQYSFRLFCVYLASGLGLLMSTSLMGLRRYLQRRKLEIAPEMVGNWLIHGTVLVVVLLVVAALLPRPGAEYAISQIPELSGWRGERPETTEFAVGQEGVQDPQRADREGTGPDAEAESPPESASDPQTPRANSDPSTGSGSGPPQAGDQADDPGQTPDRNAQAEPGPPPENPSRDSPTPPSDRAPEQPQPSPERSQSSPERPQPPPEQPQSSPERSQSSPEGPQRQLRPAPQPPLRQPAGIRLATIIQGLRALAYVALAIFVAYLTWRYRKLILAALRDLYSAIADFCNGLRGKSPDAPSAPEAGLAVEPARRFADCPDPFHSAGALPAAVVKATLEGLEAWASEHGNPRDDEQTLEEFTRDLVRILSRMPDTLQGELKVLTRLHNQIAYAGRRVTMEQVQPLKRLWATLGRYPGRAESPANSE